MILTSSVGQTDEMVDVPYSTGRNSGLELVEGFAREVGVAAPRLIC
jgi:hypothetical protein